MIEISEQEHQRFVRGELASIEWAAIWLAVTSIALGVIAAVLLSRFYFHRG